MSAALLLALAAALPPDDEGPLRNRTPFARTPAAEDALREGDRAWARVAAGAAAPVRNEAFDAWRRALEASAPGDGVPAADPGGPEGLFPDPDGTLDRRGEGVQAAVLRRLASLEPAARAAWRARFDASADAALAAAGRRPDALARVERDHPLTPSAARAALARADLALELGRSGAARVWLERAATHARGSELEAAVADAVAARRPLVARPRAAAGPWREADALEAVRSVRLEGLRTAQHEPFGRGVSPGLAFLDDGGLTVQSPRALVTLDAAAARGEAGGAVERVALGRVLGVERVRTLAAPSTGGWPSLPASDGRRVVVVAGRGEPGRTYRDLPLPPTGNLLAALVRGADGRMERVWRVGDGGRALGASRDAVEDDPSGWRWGRGWEFQPGPAVADDAVLVLARRLADPTRDDAADAAADDELRLFALELADGSLRWSRRVTRASDVDADGRRGRAGTGLATSGMPLAVADGHVLVGTNVGLLASYDLADGRLAWSLRNQRRDADGGWPGSRRPLVRDGRAWFAPFDSEFLYALPAGGLPDGGRVLLAPPRARDGALDLAEAEGETLLLLGRVGRHHAVLVDAPGAARRPALFLGGGERFAGRALASPARLLVAGDRYLYLHDRGSDLLLRSATPLRDQAGRGGDVYARGDRVYVLGRDALWILRP